MSEMSDPKQAREWVASWRAHYATTPAGPVGLARRLRQAAAEQRANFHGCRRSGWQGVKGRAAYEESVAFLEAEAKKAEAAAEEWRAAEAARLEELEERAAARRAELMARYPEGSR